ncbi:hypothetical protein G5I_13479 [Acromyrmex echinatior]|uniref:Uncharacterized protein n=1 Tax=Acromyrmex echinatior TaxID=103372 RepID=F4X555_ACREC|nr:hypothetical protein G5I_13479 [Acromyrmex echinatior]
MQIRENCELNLIDEVGIKYCLKVFPEDDAHAKNEIINFEICSVANDIIRRASKDKFKEALNIRPDYAGIRKLIRNRKQSTRKINNQASHEESMFLGAIKREWFYQLRNNLIEQSITRCTS